MRKSVSPNRSRKDHDRQRSLGTRLTFLILPLILIPFTLVGLGAYLRARDILKNQANAQMSSALQAQVESLNDWVFERQSHLFLGALREELKSSTAEILVNPNEETRQVAREILQELRTRKDESLFSDLFIVSMREDGQVGKVLVSTNPNWEGNAFPSLSLINTNQIDTAPFFDLPDLAPGGLTFISSTPVRAQGKPAPDSLLIGVNSDLRVAALLETMQVFWEQRGIYRIERGNAFLAIPPDILIQASRYSMMPTIQRDFVHPVLAGTVQEGGGILEYQNPDGQRMLGAYQWIPKWTMAVIIELPRDEAFAGLTTLAPYVGGLILFTIILLALLIPLIARRSLRPLATLTVFAERVASGDLEHRLSIEQKDEIGRLAQAFNYMTNELAQLYHSLEERVFQRTEEVRLAAEVARDATAMRDIEQLLDESVKLISERFGFYHVAIFLFDDEKKTAVLRAASSEGGKRMRKRGHRLPIGITGIVGHVTEHGEARIAADVSQDAVYFANPDLPETRSELAIPLKVSGMIIGALDIQSKERKAFSESDLLFLQIIADQLAVAIENARLLLSQTTLAEQRSKVISIFHRFSQQTNYEALIEDIPKAIREVFHLSRVTLGLVEHEEVIVRSVSASESASSPSPVGSAPIGEGILGQTVALKQTQQLAQRQLHELETQDPRHNISRTILAIPLITRDRVFGTLAIEAGARGELSKDEIDALELVAAQCATSLENARLLEEMQRNLDQIDILYRQQTSAAWSQMFGRQEGGDEATVEFGIPLLDQESANTSLETPIELRGEVIGKLNLQGLRSGDWTEEDQEILEAVADELATSLEQVRLMEEINRKVAQLQTAAEIARTSSTLLHMDALLNRVVTLIQERFGYYHVSIFFVNKNSESAVLQEAAGESAEILKALGYSQGLYTKSVISRTISTGDYYLATQVQSDPFFQPNPDLPNTKSELGIPLKIGQRVIGAIDIAQDREDAFGEDDISVLQILADQVAVAVQNVRLFEQTLHRADREKAVVEITSHIRAERDVDKIMRTVLIEMSKALGASEARIQLSAEKTDGKDTIDMTEHPVAASEGEAEHPDDREGG